MIPHRRPHVLEAYDWRVFWRPREALSTFALENSSSRLRSLKAGKGAAGRGAAGRGAAGRGAAGRGFARSGADGVSSDAGGHEPIWVAAACCIPKTSALDGVRLMVIGPVVRR